MKNNLRSKGGDEQVDVVEGEVLDQLAVDGSVHQALQQLLVGLQCAQLVQHVQR